MLYANGRATPTSTIASTPFWRGVSSLWVDVYAGGAPAGAAGVERARTFTLFAAVFVMLGLGTVGLLLARRARELSALRSTFVSSVSHELRTPLTQIMLFAELMEFGRLRSDRERTEAGAIIARESRRLLQLIDNVLLFSRGEREQTAARVRMQPLAPIIEQTTVLFQPLARESHARISTALDETLCAPVNAEALRQIVLNLLENAVKYGPRHGRVQIEARLSGDGARIAVTDEGPGIPHADRERVWQPFRSARAAR